MIGHASGRQSPYAEGDAGEALKSTHRPSRRRAPTSSPCTFFADPKLVELGVIPRPLTSAITRTQYEAYTRVALTQLLRVGRNATRSNRSHAQPADVVRWLMANTKAIEADPRWQDGTT